MYFVLRRGLTLGVTLILISFLTFLVFQIIPGDPVLTILGMDAEKGQILALQEKLGLDKPLFQRFISWMGGVFSGNLGESLRFSRPVLDLMMSRLPVTISLALISLGVTIIIAIPLGILAAKVRGQWLDYLISLLTQLGMAIPSFWLGIILMFIFGVIFRWFTPGSYVPWSEDFWGAFKGLFLPALAMAIPKIAVLVRYLRAAVLEQLKLEYVRTAYGKGLGQNVVVNKHVLKNALIPVVTVLGMIVADVLGGSLIIEQVFALPGMGRLLVSSISYRDFPLVQGMILYIAIIVTCINFIVDIMYGLLDPRIRLE